MSSPQNPPPQPPVWQPATPPHVPAQRGDALARWFAAVGVVFGVAGLAIAFWSVAMRGEAVAKPGGSSTAPTAVDETFSTEEIAAAKLKICEAHEFVSAAVANANAPRDSGGDEALANAYVALSQNSLSSGAAYLQNQLDDAVPSELREMVELLIQKYLRVAVGGAGGGGDQYISDVAEANTTSTEVKRLCQ